jgi:hypothetical protein
VDKVYNSPPNWPPPPEGWTPEPGWQPDPGWGPAPPDWQFWVDAADEPAPAPEWAPVLLADPGHAGNEPGGATEQTRTPPIAYLLIVVPFLTLGFAAWVPALWAGLKRPAGTRARKELFILSGALMAAVVVAFLFVDSAPEDSAGEASGPLLAIGSILWILTMVIGTVVAVAFRKPPAAEPARGSQ